MLIQPVQQPRTAPRAATQAPTTPSTPAAPGPATSVPVGNDLASLTAQLADLKVQEAGLKAQWRGLRNQLDNMLQNNPARPGVQQQWADVGVNLAKVQGQIAVVEAKVQAQGVSLTGTTAPPPGRNGPDPDMVVGLTFATFMVIGLPLSIALARRMWRGKPQPPGVKQDEITPRLDRLEQAVDTIAIEIERISEGQRFVTKIMAERPAQQAVSGGAQNALGAGPAEPVVVPDRDAVRVNR